ncbi:MAG: ABC transporter permease, partial [Lachnospiraceae bacterium]|nr:ABC transporter permease [Lachnospiraceae bacterium]
MAEITRERFKVVGKNTRSMESISRPNIGYWQDAWRRIRKNKIAFFSLCLISLYILVAIFAPMLSQYDYAAQSVE